MITIDRSTKGYFVKSCDNYSSEQGIILNVRRDVDPKRYDKVIVSYNESKYYHLTSILHELGHIANDHLSVSNLALDYKFKEMMFLNKQDSEVCLKILIRECDAWRYALKCIKLNNLSAYLQFHIKMYIISCIGTYHEVCYDLSENHNTFFMSDIESYIFN
jgi:hypothetical protein